MTMIHRRSLRVSADIKRLSPTKGTIRELFGKCGNQCAFPKCKHEIIDADGVFVAEICHIEAAEVGGPRFNRKQTNEQRRHVSNLMLMCHKHHKVTDNIEKYPSDVLKEMKRKHEAKYLDAANKIWASIEDHTESDEVSLPKTFKRFFRVEGIAGKDREPVRKAIRELAKRLKPVPVPCREILLHSLRRASAPEYSSSEQVIAEEVAQACNIRTRDLWTSVRILIRHELVYYDDDYPSVYSMRHVGDLDDWDIWMALRSFCEETEVDLQEILVNLRFDVLDG
jgi:hypothetical protein